MILQLADDCIVVDGVLRVWEGEAGFAPDDAEIDGMDLPELAAALFGMHLNARGSLGNRSLGRVRLTLERLTDEGEGRQGGAA